MHVVLRAVRVVVVDDKLDVIHICSAHTQGKENQKGEGTGARKQGQHGLSFCVLARYRVVHLHQVMFAREKVQECDLSS